MAQKPLNFFCSISICDPISLWPISVGVWCGRERGRMQAYVYMRAHTPGWFNYNSK